MGYVSFNDMTGVRLSVQDEICKMCSCANIQWNEYTVTVIIYNTRICCCKQAHEVVFTSFFRIATRNDLCTIAVCAQNM